MNMPCRVQQRVSYSVVSNQEEDMLDLAGDAFVKLMWNVDDTEAVMNDKKILLMPRVIHGLPVVMLILRKCNA